MNDVTCRTKHNETREINCIILFCLSFFFLCANAFNTHETALRKIKCKKKKNRYVLKRVESVYQAKLSACGQTSAYLVSAPARETQAPSKIVKLPKSIFHLVKERKGSNEMRFTFLFSMYLLRGRRASQSFG